MKADTGELKALEEGKYTELSFGDKLGTTDGLIFNLDPSIIEDSEGKPTSEIASQLGEGVELHNFEEIGIEDSGLTSKSFNFDGIDDYITVKSNSNNRH